MARRPEKLCVVTIGIDYYVLPMSDGIRLVDIIAGALPVEGQHFGLPSEKYRPRELIGNIGLRAIRPDQIIDTKSSVAGRSGPLLRTHTTGA